MRKIISILTVLQVMYLTSSVESLQGHNIRQVRNGDLSFVASLQYFPEEEIFCTGVLITTKHVITTASCMEGENPSKTRVVFQTVSPLEAVVTELLYEIISWQPYYSWAVGRGLHNKEPDLDGIAVIRLKQEVNNHINPARLSQMNKRQNIGKRVIITGWKDGVSNSGLLMSVVHVLKDKDCNEKQKQITEKSMKFGQRLLCSCAKTLALLENGDAGAPLMDINKNIIGLALGRAPDLTRLPSDSSNALKQYQVNVHFNIDHYRQFIVNITGYH